MSFLRHREIYPSDGGAIVAGRAPAHRLDESPAGYSSAVCSPAGTASASPAGSQYAVQSYCRSRIFHRTVNSVLTGCLTSGDKPKPTPGFEIKAWFPLATEITARFRDSQNHFTQDNIHVAMLAWLPDDLIYGKPRIIDVCIASGKSVAEARDSHYHNPPQYLVLEPEDTSARTRNLRQTNTNGLRFQGTPEESEKARRIVESWGPQGRQYKPTRDYQRRLQDLRSQFNYRLDTNYAKMDRIAHPGIEEFKSKIENTGVNGLTVAQWKRILAFEHDDPSKQAMKEGVLRKALADHLGIK